MCHVSYMCYLISNNFYIILTLSTPSVLSSSWTAALRLHNILYSISVFYIWHEYVVQFASSVSDWLISSDADVCCLWIIRSTSLYRLQLVSVRPLTRWFILAHLEASSSSATFFFIWPFRLLIGFSCPPQSMTLVASVLYFSSVHSRKDAPWLKPTQIIGKGWTTVHCIINIIYTAMLGLKYQMNEERLL